MNKKIWNDSHGRVKWKYYFLGLCFVINQRSIDPSTKHGCIITDTENNILSVGYNSCPRFCDENVVPTTRPDKYDWMVHSEEAAISNAARNGISLKDSIFYITGKPCDRCLRGIINCGAKKIIYGPLKTKVDTSQNFSKMLESYQGNIEVEEIDNFDNILNFLNSIVEYIEGLK